MLFRMKRIFTSLLLAASLTAVVFSEELIVDDITFSGNQSISAKTLLTRLNLTPATWLKRVPFNNRALKLDVIAMKNYYMANGFIDVKIDYKTEMVSELWVSIHYTIDEGNRYYLEGVAFEGNSELTVEELLKNLDMKVGSPYNPSAVLNFISKTEYEYFTRGKLLVSIKHSVEQNNNKLFLVVRINEGNTFYINGTNLSGLEKYPEKFLLRELTFHSGEIYDIRQIEKSQQRIFSSGLFSSVEVIPKVDPENADQVNIDIKVREYVAKQVKTDVGIGQEPSTLGEGAPPSTVLELQLKWQPGTILNSAGRVEFGGNVSARLDKYFSVPSWDYEINWFTPWLFKLRVPLRLSYYHREKTGDIIDGFESSFMYKTGNDFKLTGSLKLEYINTLGTDQKRSVQFDYYRHDLDNYIYPTRGFYRSVTTELNGTILGGERHYFKIDTQFKRFYKAFDKFVLAFHLKSGYLHMFKEGPEGTMTLPAFYKFKLGGSTSLRGWRDTDDFDENGGMLRHQVNMEIRYPLFWLLGGELFIDAGKLADEFNSEQFKNWDWDVGTGITISTPIGPARIDVAWPYAHWSEPTVLLSVLYLF